MKQAEFDSTALEKVSVEKETDPYEDGRRSTLIEALLSGAADGAMRSSISGILAGLGVLHLQGLGFEHAALQAQEFAWAQTALGATFAGAFIRAIFGAFIGWGIQDGDANLYKQSREEGRLLVKLETQPERAGEAAQILAQIDREARFERSHALA